MERGCGHGRRYGMGRGAGRKWEAANPREQSRRDQGDSYSSIFY